MNEIKIGDLIREARVNSGYKTKKEFADISGVSPATLTRIEKNTQKPFPDTLMQISRHLSNVTYGQLMKAAGYLEGMNEDHEEFITNFMNENSELDDKVFNLIDSLISFTEIDCALHNEIINLFVNEESAGLYSNSTSDQIKNIYLNSDYGIENKLEIINQLNDLLKKYSPKLGVYLSLNKNIVPIPLVGTICAGDGIIANEYIEEYIHYPFLNKRQPDYALKVKGNSMINAGIEDGDIVFLRKESWAEYNGQIVAVIINGEEGTLKRMNWSEGSNKFKLVPENSEYQSMEVTPNEFIVCGVYAGHFRPEF
jgi:repressor LexA